MIFGNETAPPAGLSTVLSHPVNISRLKAMSVIREKQEEEVKRKTNKGEEGIAHTWDGPPTDNCNGGQKCDQKMMPAKHKLDTVQAGKM